MQVILEDMRAQREEFDKLSKKVAAELKEVLAQEDATLATRAAEASKVEQANAKTTADLKKSRVELDAEEQKNLEKISALTDQMPPENAAAVIQQLADSGKLDTAVKILVNMKPRTASRVLANISDPVLASQLLERMRSVKQPVAANTTK
jgi:flagellar motility protein MotE (MotC chaperone)